MLVRASWRKPQGDLGRNLNMLSITGATTVALRISANLALANGNAPAKLSASAYGGC